MRSFFAITLLFVLSSLTNLTLAHGESGVVCTKGWSVQEKDFLEFNEPVIGFTETDFTEMGWHWYLVEKELAPLLNFKSYFTYDESYSQFVYIDGLEIGEKFVTPATDWIELEFHDETHYWLNMSTAFVELTAFASRCELLLL